jgi:hypothetical protein
VISVERGTVGCNDTFGGLKVLNRDRQTMQKTERLTVNDRFGCQCCFLKSPILGQGYHRIQGGVQRLNSP